MKQATYQKKESESVTFRLTKDIVNKLRQESEQNKISLNTLASQVLTNHIDYQANAGKALLVAFPKALLVKIMEFIPEAEISKLAEYIAKREVADIILLIKNEYTTEAFLQVVESWALSSGFAYKHTVKEGRHSFVIQHDMSKKWSFYLAELFRNVFEEVAKKKGEFQITDNTFVFHIDTSK